MIFDLWDTLVDYPADDWDALQPQLAECVGIEPRKFTELWRSAYNARQVGPLAASIEPLGFDPTGVERLLELRREWTRRVLVPRVGAVATLRELRERGYRVGLISVCSEEVPELWDETELAPLVEEPVFSCSVGIAKPDARIYELACERLGVEPSDALFVGDGANDELAGAERAGLRAVLILRPDQDEPFWEEARGWQPRITALPQVLELL